MSVDCPVGKGRTLTFGGEKKVVGRRKGTRN